MSVGDPCNSRDPKWGDEARRLIEQHLGPPAQESPDGLEAVYFCPVSGQQWLSDHPNRTERNPGPMRIRIVHAQPPWWKREPEVIGRIGPSDTYEVACCECGDDPDLDYRDVSIQLQRIRGPYSIAAGGDAREKHVRYHHEQNLAACERVLGPDHPDTLASRNNLANAHQAAGRADEAITLHEQNLAARERVLGPDQPATLQSRNNLANAYQATGRSGEAGF